MLQSMTNQSEYFQHQNIFNNYMVRLNIEQLMCRNVTESHEDMSEISQIKGESLL
jgi:hypothetical protein